MKQSKNKIFLVLSGVFFCLLLLFFTPSSSKAQDCGSYASGPFECVRSCEWYDPSNYCRNNEITWCSPSNINCINYAPPGKTYGCWTWSAVTRDINCGSFTNEVDCISATPPTDFLGCASSGGGEEEQTCSCGRQECDFSVPGCQCLYIGCKVGGNDGASCVKYTCSVAPPPTPSCSMTLAPASITIGNNTTTIFIASVTPANGTVTNVTFVSSNTGVATINPASDASNPYSTIASATNTGSTAITASAVMSGSVRCTDISYLYVINSDPWWQVKDGDVTTNGDLRSGAAVPSGNYFDLAGTGGYPGLPVYGGSTNLTTSNVSVKGWLANSTYSSSKLFNSNYFFNAIPEETTPNIIEISTNSVTGTFFESGGTPSFGYYWYMYDGTATGLPFNITSAANLGSRKVILLVKGADLRLNSTVNLNDGLGFFFAATTGNIIVDPAVGGGVDANLEGVYVADGGFSTGTTGTNSDTKLWVRGTVAAFGGMNLQRDLADNGGSAELFEFAPDQELLFPTKLSYYPSAWREVAP